MKNYSKKPLTLLLSVFMLFNISVFAQGLDEIPGGLTANTSNDRVRLAMTTTDYRVTAGDVYNLSFLAGNTPISYIINVDPTYKIRVANLAVLNVADTSFLSLKRQVEEIVTKNYPMSGVQFNLVSPGSFKVIVKGEVNQAAEVDAWALTRLSEVVNTHKNKFASERNITVLRNGKKYSYDLFKAKRYGDFDNDPYLRPGDVVTLNPIDRRVNISGAVERPGTYELLKDESLVDLVDVYGHGLLPMADTSRIEVTKVFDQEKKSGQKVYLNSVDPKYKINNYDSVFIPTFTDLKPIVFVEGAILIPEAIKTEKDDKSEEAEAKSSELQESNRTSVRFDEGLNYASFVRSNAQWFTSSKSDIDNAYIIRGDERIGINLRDILYDNGYYSDLVVENNDTLLVPFKQTYVVTVTGEVSRKGEVPTSALTRLSSVIDSVATSFSSRRNITIKSVDGGIKNCDLFKASRDGDLSLDPYLKPGDEIHVGRIDRKVTISGAVERPGTYEILEGENIEDLVNNYGNGLLPTADTSRIEVTKVLDGQDKTGEKIYFDKIDSSFKLSNYDTVYIPNFGDLKPIVYVEGAIYTEGSEMNDSVKLPVRFTPGTNYASFIRSNEGWFTSTKSDIDNAYIVRGEERIDIDIRKILYDDEKILSDLTVEPNDTLTVPFKQTYIVYVDGEVSVCGEVPINAFTRLSTVVNSVATSYSSSRNVTIRSTDGDVRECDLFIATRDGDLSQNPYLKPGDRITVGRLERKVTINGAVERPGTYELLPGENLKELVEKYGHGLTPLADTSRIKITKIIDSKVAGGEVAYLNEIEDDYELNCYDVVAIPTYQELKPIVFVEGAIYTEGSAMTDSIRIPVRFTLGLNYASFIRDNEGWFGSTKSDIDNAYIVRGEDRIEINIRKILYDRSYFSDLVVEPNDVLTVPFKQTYIVYVDGEVSVCGEVPINAFTRLSSVVDSVATPYSSSRDVIIHSTDGEVKQCDLFKATRDGDLSQNPYLKPSDRITVGRLDRKVTIKGAVERPGTYELLPGENLKELIEKYGHGLAPLADTSRIKITKILDSKNAGGEVAYLREIDPGYPLNCYDVIEISSYQELKPIVFIEGAIGGETGETELKGSDRVSIRFDEGLNYSTFVRENQQLFTAKSDLENAYIIRNEERISINLEQILYDKSYYSDLEVKPYDTLLVPFKQRYISVAGAVAMPGRYPYIPDRTYEYYIGVAGGFIDEKNTGKAVEIIDIDGNKLSKGDIIPPEATITAKANSFTYYFNIYAPIITTLLGLVSTSISLGMIFKK